MGMFSQVEHSLMTKAMKSIHALSQTLTPNMIIAASRPLTLYATYRLMWEIYL